MLATVIVQVLLSEWMTTRRILPNGNRGYLITVTDDDEAEEEEDDDEPIATAAAPVVAAAPGCITCMP